MKKGILLLNGTAPSDKLLQSICADFTVCCDGAYNYARGKVKIDLLMGDFDSIEGDIPLDITVKKYNADKDFTDGHLGLEELLISGCDRIEIYGALGKRFDHQLSNLSLLYLALKRGAEAEIIDDNCTVLIIDNNLHFPASAGDIISLVPFSDRVHILYTKGLKYPIKDKILEKTHILGISNEAAGERIEIGLDEGVLTVIKSARR